MYVPIGVSKLDLTCSHNTLVSHNHFYRRRILLMMMQLGPFLAWQYTVSAFAYFQRQSLTWRQLCTSFCGHRRTTGPMGPVALQTISYPQYIRRQLTRVRSPLERWLYSTITQDTAQLQQPPAPSLGAQMQGLLHVRLQNLQHLQRRTVGVKLSL